jgi:hypothetical protein
MTVSEDRVELRCAACGSSVPIRRCDPERGDWMVELDAPDEPPAAQWTLDVALRRVDHELEARPPAEAGLSDLPPTPPDESPMTAGMATPISAPAPAQGEGEGISPRPIIERRPDYGNVIHVACRHCGEPSLLDPARLDSQKLGVFLWCRHCARRFLVRHTDLNRPDPGWVASLYTAERPDVDAESESESTPHPRSKRILRRS